MSQQNESTANNSSSFAKYLTPMGAFALAFGSSLGWGSFVMPGTTFLPSAGPLGALIGFLIGIISMLIVCINYDYMINKFPDSGGTYTYTKEMFGHDHAFISAWFLILCYAAIIWANATAVSLISKYLFGNILQSGFHYQIADHIIYFNEALVSVAFLVVFGLVCICGNKIAEKIQIISSFGLFFGILICFIMVMAHHQGSFSSYMPYYVPNRNAFIQVLTIAMMTPWAFVGLESISHSSEEFVFSSKKSLAIMTIALFLSAAAYVMLIIVAISILPQGYENWFSYISDLKNLEGKMGLPTLYAVEYSMGSWGIPVLAVTVCCGIISGLIGCYVAGSRLLYAMAKDGMFPETFCKLNSKQIPYNSVLFLMAVSSIIPFLQRTAIGWIIDITTFGTGLAYSYTSASAYVAAKQDNNKKIKITGIAGIVFSVLFALFLLIPNRSIAALDKESYFIITIWCILGLLFFRHVYAKNPQKHMNVANVVWISMLVLILFTTGIWTNQSSKTISNDIVTNIHKYYYEIMKDSDHKETSLEAAQTDLYLNGQITKLNNTISFYGMVQLGVVILVLVLMFNIYTIVRKREEQIKSEKEQTERSNKMKSAFLFNMSHDIRTPMNAIVGYTTLAKKEKNIPPELKEYLNKIEISSRHMLAVLNDVLEMSRIESNQKELVLSENDLNLIMEEVKEMFAGQMQEKQINYSVAVENLSDPIVLCDKNCLNRILLNIISNAWKFTSEKGSVSVLLSQLSKEEKVGNYEIRIKDNGVGIDDEFLPKLYNAFEREKTSTDSGLQGTGLGLAITKRIVDLMKGSISINTKKGLGTEFVINLPLTIIEQKAEEPQTQEVENNKVDFSKMKLLLVEDIVINREIAKMLLGQMGFNVDCAENGKIAVDMITNSRPGEYSAVLMDIQMPVMNGYDASIAIRALKNKELANIPIIAMTANVLPEDIQKAKESGMNGHIAKPIDVADMTNTLVEILIKKRG